MGTATGFIIERGDAEIVHLPGVPKEMQSILKNIWRFMQKNMVHREIEWNEVEKQVEI